MLKMMKTLALPEEGVPPSASDQIGTDCHLTPLIGTCVDVVRVACIVNYCDSANLFTLAVGVKVKAMVSHPRHKNRVEV